MKKQDKGITLVALVITVIILLILAGITLSLTIGENGIIAKAKQAKENMLQAEKEEEEALNTLWAELENNGINIGDSVEVKEDEATKELKKEIEQLQNQKNQLEESNQIKDEQISNLQNELNTKNEQIASLKNEINTKSSVEYLGTGISFNIKELYPNEYQNFSEDNFIVGIQSAPNVMSSRYSTGVANREDRAHALGCTIGKSYNAQTGILTISGNTQTVLINTRRNRLYMDCGFSNNDVFCLFKKITGMIISVTKMLRSKEKSTLLFSLYMYCFVMFFNYT